MLNTQAIGNIAEKAIELELERLKPEIKTVTRIPNQDDPNHWDLLITLTEGYTVFIVQAKALTSAEANLTLDMTHISDWLNAQPLTVPMWWDEARRKAYWADIIRYLVRTSGTRNRKTATFSRAYDLHELNTKNSGSKARFLRWVKQFSAIWPRIHGKGLSSWALNPEFPVKFVDAIRNPDILSYLPVNANLVNIIDDYTGRTNSDRTKIINDVFRIGVIALQSPDSAAKELARIYEIPLQDREVVDQIIGLLSYWADRIHSDSKLQTARTLWAFDKIVSMICYERLGDLQLPMFTSTHTYPLGGLISLLPSDIFVEPLTKILTMDNDPKVLLHAAYCLGLLNQPSKTEAWRETRNLRRHIIARQANIGQMGRAVHRQLLYTEVQLGSEEAKAQFIRALKYKGGLRFDAAYNFNYYQKNRSLIQARFERRLEENLRSDRFVREILVLIYEGLRTSISEHSKALNGIDPELWPTD